MNWILVFIWHRFNTVHWNSLRLFLCLQIHCMSNACVDGYTFNYKLHVFIIIWVSRDQRSRMVLNTRSTWFESWLRLNYTLFTMHLQHFITRVVFFVFLCFLYEPVISINIIFGIIWHMVHSTSCASSTCRFVVRTTYTRYIVHQLERYLRCSPSH